MDCPSPDMLSEHSKARDEYGIPVANVRRKVVFRVHFEEMKRNASRWNLDHESLQSIIGDVHGLQCRIDFLQKWLWPRLYLTKHPSINQPADLSDDTSVKDEIATLEKRKAHLVVRWNSILTAMRILLEDALMEIPDEFPGNPNPFQPSFTFIRYWNDDSHTEFDDSLGFRCSNWKQCKPAGSFLGLEKHGILTTGGLQNHRQNTRLPSCWISVCDDLSHLLKHMKKKKARHVAIVSVANLNKLNILWERSDLLGQQARERVYSGKHENGVHFAWSAHFLVYGWIPAQCVIRRYTARMFLQLCKERSITKGWYFHAFFWHPGPKA